MRRLSLLKAILSMSSTSVARALKVGAFRGCGGDEESRLAEVLQNDEEVDMASVATNLQRRQYACRKRTC